MSAQSMTLARQKLAPSPVLVDAALSPAQVLAKNVPFQGPSTDEGRETVPLQGRLPEWLRGTLLRTAPFFAASGDWEPAHWFDALALVFGFDVGGPDVALRWARTESRASQAARRGRVPMASFATPNGRGILARLFGPIPQPTDNANVNIVRMGDDLVSLTESPHQWTIDPYSLRNRARVAYDDDFDGRTMMLAHPVVTDDAVFNVAYTLGAKTNIMLYTHPKKSRRRALIGQWSTDELPYLHSFGLTEQSGILIAHPFLARPMSMLWSNRGFCDHFSWQPERGTRLVVIDRATGFVREHETDAFFTFHVAHAFETADATVIDLLAFDDATVVGQLSTAGLMGGMAPLQPKLKRFVIDRARGKVREHELTDVPFEFPQVDAQLAWNQKPAVVYGASITRRDERLESQIVAVDPERGSARKFREGDWIFGEPIFVGRPRRTLQGDGVLLTVGSRENASTLFVLDARSLEPLARADFSTPLPLGFHGSFVGP